jgi:ATP synthase F1 gamma subunit
MKLLSQIKQDLEFNGNLAGLIEVLKQIAIFQYQVLQKKIKSYDRIFSILQSFFEIIPYATKNISHPLVNLGNRTAGVIAVTSETGLLGALNMQVMSQALKGVEENHATLIILGEKGRVYAQERNTPFVAFEGIKDETRFSQAMKLRDYIIDQELSGRLGALSVVYPYATSIITQRIQSTQLLPLKSSKKAESPVFSEMIMESSLGDVMGFLIFLFLGQKFYDIFGQSRLAEMAARFLHLEESGHKLEDMQKQLRLQYFRQRHELIDRNMRELFAARLAFR